jgi:aminopeptidase N
VELSEIVFRLYPNLPQYGGWMRVGPVWVDGQRGTSKLQTSDTSLIVPLFETLEPEASVTISMTFDIEIPQRTSGYVLFGYSQNIWSLPDAYPLLAIHDGTAWLEDMAPAYSDAVSAEAALYEVSLTLPPTLTLATTGSVVDDTQDSGGQQVYHIAGGPLREFTWLASTDYAVMETRAHGVDLRSFYLPGDEAAGQAALYTAAAALRIYSDAFGPYPYPEMTVVEAPLRFYGMEYPGLNLIGKALYRDLRAELEERVAHEIAHQWWYAQVGNDQINAPWLDEGLAEYSTATYYRQVYGQARVNTLVNQRWLAPYQVKVESGLDAVVNQPAMAFGQEYEVIVYAKAALFFDALRQEVGAEIYDAILREYLDRYRWRIATPDNLLRVAESVSGQDLDGLYYRWILSKQ